jgi:hypothetical protein
MWPQIVMVILIIWGTANNIMDMTTTGAKRDLATSIAAAFTRAAIMVGVLYWGDFWTI